MNSFELELNNIINNSNLSMELIYYIIKSKQLQIKDFLNTAFIQQQINIQQKEQVTQQETISNE